MGKLMLKDIRPIEISLVNVPANLRRFYLLKEGDEMEELKEMIEKWIGDGKDGLSDRQIEVLKALSDKAQAAVKGALKLLAKYKEEFPQDVKNAIGVLAKSVGYGYPSPKEEKKEPEKEEEVKKAGAKFSKITLSQLKSLADSLQKASDAIGKLLSTSVKKDQRGEEEEEDGKEKKEEKIYTEKEALKMIGDGIKEGIEKALGEAPPRE